MIFFKRVDACPEGLLRDSKERAEMIRLLQALELTSRGRGFGGGRGFLRTRVPLPDGSRGTPETENRYV